MGRARHGGPEWKTIKARVLGGSTIASVARSYAKKFGKTEKQMACLIRVRKCKEGWQKNGKPTVKEVESRLKGTKPGPKADMIPFPGGDSSTWVEVDSLQKTWIKDSWDDLKKVQKELRADRASKKNPDGILPEKMTKCFQEIVQSGLKLLAAERNVYVNEQLEAEQEKSRTATTEKETEDVHELLNTRIDEHNKPKSNVS